MTAPGNSPMIGLINAGSSSLRFGFYKCGREGIALSLNELPRRTEIDCRSVRLGQPEGCDVSHFEELNYVMKTLAGLFPNPAACGKGRSQW